MKIACRVEELIGNPPHYQLQSLGSQLAPEIYLKLESFNPGKSVKDRIAFNMIRRAEENGELKPGGVIVEPTSGNTGIGLALIGASRGYRVILTMPDTMSQERRQLFKAFGAEMVLTPGENGMKGAIETARDLVRGNENYYMPGQFTNPANPEIHQLTTAEEILADFGDRLDYLVAGVGTGGTLTGIGRAFQEKSVKTKLIAVEPADSAVLSGEEPGSHKIQGIGAGFIPEILEVELIDEVIRVSNEEASACTRKLARMEGLLLGISSGAATAAALKLAKKVAENSTILTIAPDTGERYLSLNIFNINPGSEQQLSE